MRFFLCFLIVYVISLSVAKAQLSEGGFPLSVMELKSTDKPLVKMPLLPQGTIDSIIADDYSADRMLKSLLFAYAYDVSLKPSNSGQWYSSGTGYNVWKITIESEDAQSLNLILDNFKLPENTRLFVYNEEENHYLGAFTFANNKSSGKFAVAPVAGDKITVQYEVPEEMGMPSDFEIVKVNHDFLGVLKRYRRPKGESGDCNVNVNCELGKRWKELKNSTCRLIIDGSELCSGTLINNTAEDEKPYVLSAWHCFEDNWDHAETTIFTFNYESPYCEPIDGDPGHTLSGATMKALYDTLDFALMEMDDVPPSEYRPYYAGWSRFDGLPDSSLSIHHPLGDIKKISLDYDKPDYFTYISSCINNPDSGSFDILRWDVGVTEGGSSGGALYNMDGCVIGTLTGGSALCGNPVNDYYARLAMQWDYSSDSTEQLKCWLDPLNTGTESLEGKQFNTGNDLCMAFTHLTDDDSYENVAIVAAESKKGYWGGSNSVDIDEIMERFYFSENVTLDGVSLGVAKVYDRNNSTIIVKVYDGNSMPESLIYSETVRIDDLETDAMNYIAFDETVSPSDTFFVGFSIDGTISGDTVAIYQSLREDTESDNYFYYKQNGEWYNYKETNTNGYAMVNVMELIACNCVGTNSVETIANSENVSVFPNPTSGSLTLKSDKKISAETISVYNLIGQTADFSIEQAESNIAKINIYANTPGVYFVRFGYGNDCVVRKITCMP